MDRGQHSCQQLCRKEPIVSSLQLLLRQKKLNAETVTTIATSFLKRIGHKSGIKPKRVTLEEGAYIIEMKKLMAIVRVDAETHEIKEYEMQPKGEESSLFPFRQK